MNPSPQPSAPTQPVVTMFLKPSFMVTAQSSGLLVSVTLQTPVAPPEARN